MKKLIVALLTLTMVFALVGCGGAKEEPETNTSSPSASAQLSGENTLGNKLGILFLADAVMDKDLMTMGQELADISGYDCVVIEAQEGYLNGFTEEVKGFSAGVQFAPMIGSIPFVGYIFETDDADALMAKLNATADPRWNICTEAAETVCIKQGNYVFFTMCPDEEEQ